MTAQLLRQPRGFEGFCGIKVVPHPNNLAILKLVDQAHVQFDRHATCLARRPLAEHADNAVIPSIDYALKLNGPFEIFGPGAHEVEEPIAARVDPAKTWAVGWQYPLRIGGIQPRIEGRGGIAGSQPRLELLECPAHNLHILLRHGPRSIAQCLPSHLSADKPTTGFALPRIEVAA